ncbi:MAG: RNA polymerase sigma factor [Fusobacteriaceae bacterium]
MANFEEIYEEYFDRIYYKILGTVKNSEDAEDIAQETFISVYKNIDKFKGESSIYTWIFKIALNKTYDFFRKRKINLEFNPEIFDVEDGKDQNNDIILKERLGKLGKQEREFVLLKDIYGYKLHEISKLKNMNVSTVKSIYYKALRDMEE